MRYLNASRIFRHSADRRGFALPVAVFGLLATSVIVGSILVTSSTESALSRAHQDGAAELYAVEGALQAYLAGVRELVPGTTSGFRARASDPSVTIHVQRVAQREVAGGTEEVFMVAAESERGNRGVSTLVRTAPRPETTLNIESAAVFGGRAEVIGNNALIHDGGAANWPAGSVRSCDADSAAHNAVVHASGSSFSFQNRQNITGGIEQSTLGKEDLIHSTLGTSIRGLLPFAQIKFGPHFGESRWSEADPNFITGSTVDAGTKPSSLLNNNSALRNLLHKYNWRCPGLLDNRQNCWNTFRADTTEYKVVAIDGENRNVTINGDHGQGMLIVINGRLRIQGGFQFRGVIVSEQDIDISGTGNKIQGAVISQNNVNILQQTASDTTTTIGGDAVIIYNRCAINAVARALDPSLQNGEAGRFHTYGWQTIR